MSTADRLMQAYMQVLDDVIGPGTVTQQDLARLNILQNWGFAIDDRAYALGKLAKAPAKLPAADAYAGFAQAAQELGPQPGEAEEIATRPETQALTGEAPVPAQAPDLPEGDIIDTRPPEDVKPAEPDAELIDTRRRDVSGKRDDEPQPHPGAPVYQ